MITREALTKINTPQIRLRLAMALKVTEQTIIRYISDNHENLTKAASLQVIRDATGFNLDQILQDTNLVA